MNNKEFTQEKLVCRGGYLKANEEIKVTIVGSDSGVFTNLEVRKMEILCGYCLS